MAGVGERGGGVGSKGGGVGREGMYRGAHRNIEKQEASGQKPLPPAEDPTVFFVEGKFVSHLMAAGETPRGLRGKRLAG